MANIKSAQKRARQAVKRRAHNMAQRSKMRTFVKRVLAAIEAGDRETATTRFREAVPVIDAMVHKGIVHKNKAARSKSRLNAKIRLLGE